MDTTMIVLIVILALAAAIVIGILASRKYKSRTEELREHFGPEYDRVLERRGDREHGEQELLARLKRMRRVALVPLTPDARDRLVHAWTETQKQFVDDPVGAAGRADRLITELMQARGYPMVDFEQRAADISVHHPNVVQHYRAATMLALASAEGRASTEDLRQALVHYRVLFADLLETETKRAEEPKRHRWIRKEAHG